MKEVYKYLLGFIIGLLFIFIPIHYNTTPTEPIIKVDTIHTTHTDTIFVPLEKIKYVNSTIIDTIYLSPSDSILLVEQKEYKDTISTIWISGVEPRIDSISYRIPRDTFFINKEITIKEQKRIHIKPSFSAGLQIGYGISINQQPQFVPYIGFGGTIGFSIIKY